MCWKKSSNLFLLSFLEHFTKIHLSLFLPLQTLTSLCIPQEHRHVTWPKACWETGWGLGWGLREPLNDGWLVGWPGLSSAVCLMQLFLSAQHIDMHTHTCSPSIQKHGWVHYSLLFLHSERVVKWVWIEDTVSHSVSVNLPLSSLSLSLYPSLSLRISL